MQRARQKAETFAGFHRRTRQDDAVHALGQQRGDRHRHREISLPRASGANAEYHVVLFDGFEIAALVAALGLHGAASKGTLAPGVGQTSQRRVRIRRQHAQHAVEVAVVEAIARLLQAFVVGEDLLGASHVAGRAFEFDGIRPQVDGDVEAVFEQAHIFVPRSKQRLDVGAYPDALFHACLYDGGSPNF